MLDWRVMGIAHDGTLRWDVRLITPYTLRVGRTVDALVLEAKTGIAARVWLILAAAHAVGADTELVVRLVE